jgi:hypothetical protein
MVRLTHSITQLGTTKQIGRLWYYTTGETARTCCRSRNSSRDLVAKYAVISMSKLHDTSRVSKLVALVYKETVSTAHYTTVL